MLHLFIMETASESITAERAVRGANRSALSRETSISLSHISKVLSGDRVPSVRKLKQLAESMDVPMSELYDYLSRVRARRIRRGKSR